MRPRGFRHANPNETFIRSGDGAALACTKSEMANPAVERMACRYLFRVWPIRRSGPFFGVSGPANIREDYPAAARRDFRANGNDCMILTETSLKGAWLVSPEPAVDERGSFARTFCVREFAEHGLETDFVQHSRSVSVRKGTIRGMHFQGEPHGEVKLVSCIAGAILDVIVDVRPASPTYLEWLAFELTPENGRELYIPKGFAHGFQTLSDNAAVHYLISEYYRPEAGRGLRFDDPAIGIDWPLAPTVVSAKDRGWPLLASETA